jgi:hypothetical protein
VVRFVSSAILKGFISDLGMAKTIFMVIPLLRKQRKIVADAAINGVQAEPVTNWM